MNNEPGMNAAVYTGETQVFGNGDDNNHRKFSIGVTVKSTVTDAGNIPTSTVRPGMVFSIKDSDGLAYLYDDDATDGTQNARGLMKGPSGLDMLESMQNPTAVNKRVPLYLGGILKSTSLLPNVDNAALACLLRQGYVVQSADPPGAAFGLHFKGRYFKNGTTLGGAYTVLPADNGCLLIATTAAMNFTLPALNTVTRGYQVMFYNAVAATMIITAAANTIVTGDAGGALSTTLTFSTANAQMGSQALMYADYDGPGGALAWYALMVNRTVTTA